MRKFKRYLPLVLGPVLGFATALAVIAYHERPPRVWSGAATVIDGSTLELPQGRVKLWGIDAFEKDQICNGVRCGASAIKGLTAMLGTTGNVTCWQHDHDVSSGRMVALCKNAARSDIGQSLVQGGWAIVDDTFGHEPEYDVMQIFAQLHKIGVWTKGMDQTPAQWRATHSSDLD